MTSTKTEQQRDVERVRSGSGGVIVGEEASCRHHEKKRSKASGSL